MSTITRRAILAAAPAALITASPVAAITRARDPLGAEGFLVVSEFLTNEPSCRLIEFAEQIEAHDREGLNLFATYVRALAAERQGTAHRAKGKQA